MEAGMPDLDQRICSGIQQVNQQLIERREENHSNP
jgi:hypothetical protein